jgi:hypothetical protein
MRKFEFSRQLTQPKWDTLQSYMCRIQSIWTFSFRLEWDSFRTFSTPSIHDDALFPNLQHIRFGKQFIGEIRPLPPHQPLPLLVCVDIWPNSLESSSTFQGYLEWFSELSPHVTRLCMSSRYGIRPMLDIRCNTISSNHICGWRNLQISDLQAVQYNAR